MIELRLCSWLCRRLPRVNWAIVLEIADLVHGPWLNSEMQEIQLTCHVRPDAQLLLFLRRIVGERWIVVLVRAEQFVAVAMICKGIENMGVPEFVNVRR